MALDVAANHSLRRRRVSGGVLGYVALLAIMLAALPAAAEEDEPPAPGYEGATVLSKPDAQVPLDVRFNDEQGRPVRLGDFFQPDRPVLLMLVYFQCPYLCNRTLNGVAEAVRPASLTPGKDYQLVTISFDPREGPELAKAKRANYLKTWASRRPTGAS